jgi:hypothetical protein
MKIHPKELKVGDICKYKDRNGKTLKVSVTYIDKTIEPYSYEVVVKDRYITTERDRLILISK